MTYSSFYLVADQCFECVGSHAKHPLNRVEGFSVFQCQQQPVSFCIHIHESDLGLPARAELLHAFSFEYIHAEFSRIAQEYVFTMRSDRSDQLFIMYINPQEKLARCNWELNQDFTILRFGLWMCFSIFVLPESRVAIHSSAIIYQGKTVLFLGESGTGKSTHTALWRKYISDSGLLNDDSPILWAGQNEEGVPFAYAYGAPWSGKTPCYKKDMLPIAAIVRLKQAPANRMRRLTKLEAFSALFPSAPPAFAHDSILTDGVCKIISDTIRAVPFYELECLPDEAAAKLACLTIFEDVSLYPTTDEKKSADIQTRTFANELFFEQTKLFLSEGQKVRVSPLGNSMLPFLKGGVDQIEITPIIQSRYHKFSVVFAEKEGKFLIHRVIDTKIDPKTGSKQIILLGDGNFTPEIISPNDILGVVEAVFRKDGTVMCPEYFGPRSLAILWYWARPMRRYLLWLITSRRLPEYLRLWKRES